ncbi:MAG TPA: pilus assembly protein TadG-related protein [Hyphomicrobiaceae bacterium]|nr:pilus assembly protein TadG-related protein [Hyphomicrobiaceae bacterium]
MAHFPTFRTAAFRDDERGGVAIIFALSVIVITMFAGLAIDYSRINHEHNRAVMAADAAALAAGKALLDGRLTDADVIERARSYFDQNMKVAEHFGTVRGFDVKIDRTNSGVTVSATVEVPMTLGRLAGINNVVFPITAATAFKQQDIELSMALDVTGSMGGSGKLDALKSAANDLFDILLPDGGTPNMVRIALAPYSSGVNAGRYAPTVTGRASPPGNCTYERERINDVSDSAPANGSYLKAVGSPGIYGGAYCPDTSRIVPLTNDKSLLHSEVQSYEANGSTAGHLGTQWGWYLISPNWAGVFSGRNAPTAYNDKKTIKAMILMTDGEFNTVAGRGDYAGKSSKIAVSYCKAMRAQGIKVYTVGFQLEEASARQTLKDCASEPQNFFEATSGSQLRDAFKAIAEQINNLRLTS